MQRLQNHNSQKGFTILETLLVCFAVVTIAIVAYIVLINVQRNARNEQRTGEAERILAAAKKWRTDNSNAAIPTCLNPDVGCEEGTAQSDARQSIADTAGDLQFASIPDRKFALIVDTGSRGEWEGVFEDSKIGKLVAENDYFLLFGRATCQGGDELLPGSTIVMVYPVETRGNGRKVVCID